MENIKKTISLLSVIMALVLQVSCFDDDGETGGKGVLKVTVTTDEELWGYPKFTGTTCTAAYKSDTGTNIGTWHYRGVGGDGDPVDEEALYDDAILAADEGGKINMVYLYSVLGDTSKEEPVMYKGSSSVNGGIITIDKIVAGTYYVVVFYDYCSGGNLENILKRYDRYAIYTESTDSLVNFGSTSSTPYRDYAALINIKDNEPVEISLVIKRDWVLGKPATSTSDSAGRTFLKYADGIPIP